MLSHIIHNNFSGENVKRWCVAAVSLLVIIKMGVMMIGTIREALNDCDNFICKFYILVLHLQTTVLPLNFLLQISPHWCEGSYTDDAGRNHCLFYGPYEQCFTESCIVKFSIADTKKSIDLFDSGCIKSNVKL